MIYLVEIDGQQDQKVDLVEARRGVWRAQVGEGRAVEMEFRGRDADGAYIVVVDGQVRKFRLDKNCTRHLMDDGERVTRFKVDRAGEVVLDHERQVDTAWEFPVNTLDSTITGVVMEVLVKPGDQVEAGQPIVLIEAMKMENTLGAPTAGRVSRVNVSNGQTVYAGDELVSFSTH